MLIESSWGSGSKKCNDTDLEAWRSGATWGEEVRVGWQVTLISLTLLVKYGLWEGTWYKDAEQQHWGAFSIVVIKHPCPFSFEKGSGKSQRVDLCRGMEAFPGSPDLCFWGLGAWLWEVTKLYFAEFLILEYFHNIDYNG